VKANIPFLQLAGKRYKEEDFTKQIAFHRPVNVKQRMGREKVLCPMRDIRPALPSQTYC